MAYASILFLTLLLLCSLLCGLLLKTPKQKNLALLIFSLVFYAWAGPIYVPLLLLLTLIAWLVALLMQNASDAGRKKVLLLVGVLVQVAVLVGFRYTSFFLKTTHDLFGVPQVLPEIILPLGISVYTLQLISYLADVYRGAVRAEKQYWMLLTYSSLFHLSMGGPLVRYGEVQRCLSGRKLRYRDVSSGISRFAIGLTKTFLLGSALRVLVDQLLVRSQEGLAAVPSTGILLGVLLTAVQCYLTFSGYADMALGLGKMSGLRYPENFTTSLLSCSLTSFLSKWFITLGAFLRENVLVPLTKNGTRRPFLGMLLTYVLFALWFGGHWSYVLLGAFLTCALMLEERYLSHLNAVPRGVLGIIGIFLFFFFFTFTDCSRLLLAFKGLLGLNHNGFFVKETFAGLSIPLILLCVCFCLPLGRLLHNLIYTRFAKNPTVLSVAMVFETVYPMVLLVLTAVMLLSGHTFLIS